MMHKFTLFQITILNNMIWNFIPNFDTPENHVGIVTNQKMNAFPQTTKQYNTFRQHSFHQIFSNRMRATRSHVSGSPNLNFLTLLSIDGACRWFVAVTQTSVTQNWATFSNCATSSNHPAKSGCVSASRVWIRILQWFWWILHWWCVLLATVQKYYVLERILSGDTAPETQQVPDQYQT